MKKWIILLFVCFFSFSMTAIAAEDTNTVQNEIQESLFSVFDFSEVDEMLEEIFPDEKMGFLDLVTGVISGELEISTELIKELIVNQLMHELQSSKQGLIQILLLVIVAAIFSNFSSVFKSTQVSEISFSMLYMFLITICLSNFHILVEGISGNLAKLIHFMEVLGPVYFLAVGMATGSATSVAFYQLVLILIFIVELLILNFLLPVVQLYFMMKILGEFSPEIPLTKFAELLETVVRWTLKTLMAGVIGFNVIQGILMPAIDSVKRSLLMKGGEAIPVIGDLVSGSGEIVIGAAVLIKNGIGVVGMIACVAICISPIIQMTVTALLYQIVSAIVQPISDKRMVKCISSMADGSKLLLKVASVTGILFLITIAMVATTTGG